MELVELDHRMDLCIKRTVSFKLVAQACLSRFNVNMRLGQASGFLLFAWIRVGVWLNFKLSRGPWETGSPIRGPSRFMMMQTDSHREAW